MYVKFTEEYTIYRRNKWAKEHSNLSINDFKLYYIEKDSLNPYALPFKNLMWTYRGSTQGQ